MRLLLQEYSFTEILMMLVKAVDQECPARAGLFRRSMANGFPGLPLHWDNQGEQI
jgi:hypothetical protein